MIQIKNARLQRGDKLLLDYTNATIFPGQKVGLIGRNGIGKSSLFGLLLKTLQVDAGDVLVPPAWTIAVVAQDTPALDTPALEYALDGDTELRATEAELEAADALGDGDRIAHAHETLLRIDGYSARARAATLLAGLGFAPEAMTRAVKTFSGGWRMRLNLAQALMCRSDLLLLDEPTNHLDIDAVIWLEGWLERYKGTLILISHDREVLDACVDGILHLDDQQLTMYTGNYASFESQRAERLSQQQGQYDKQQRQISHLQKYVDRFRAQATKARQAQSRLKALERMERIAAVRTESSFEFSFREPASMPHQLLSLDKVTAGYGAQPILRDVTFDVAAGMRVGLLGPNGAGKSTLVKVLAGELDPLKGTRGEGQGLRVGYFAQQQLEQLDPEASPLLHLQRIDTYAREQVLRDFLGGFLFFGEMATQPVAPLSGGEKTRLALALLIWQRPNLLLLDEPTNHLDLAMRDALTFALQDYAGALIVVSHDRHLLRTTTDQLVVVHGGSVAPFDGDLDDYRRWLTTRGDSAALPTPESATAKSTMPVDRKAEKRQQAEARQRLADARKPLENQLKKLQQSLDQSQVKLDGITAWLAGEEAYLAENKSRLQEKLREQANLQADRSRLEEDWLELQIKIEAQAAE